MINIKGNVPRKMSVGAVGYDLIANDDYLIEPNSTVIVDTGTAIEFPSGVYGEVYPRSSLAIKEGLIMKNSVGIVDTDYRGTIRVALHNLNDTSKVIHKGERIAQIIFKTNVLHFDFRVVTEFNSTTERGEGGYGSTGQF